MPARASGSSGLPDHLITYSTCPYVTLCLNNCMNAQMQAANEAWPQPPVSTANGSAGASALQAALARIADPHERLLVVVGAHHFGGDANDPIRSFVRDVPWGGALLIEASPVIARELRESIASHNPLPRVPPERVRASVPTASAHCLCHRACSPTLRPSEPPTLRPSYAVCQPDSRRAGHREQRRHPR